MEQEKPAVVLARDTVLEAEEASFGGHLDRAVAKYRQAAELYMQASNQTTDPQSVMALRLLAQSHQQKAEELKLYLDAVTPTNVSVHSDSEFGTGSLDESDLGSSIYDSEVFGEVLGEKEEGGLSSVSWTGEDSMVYARSSSPLGGGGSGLPIYFVFTKNRQSDEEGDDSGSLEDHDSATESDDGSSTISFGSDRVGGEEVDDGISGAWQLMVKGMEQLLDILPRPVVSSVVQKAGKGRKKDASSSSVSSMDASLSEKEEEDEPRRKLLTYADRKELHGGGDSPTFLLRRSEGDRPHGEGSEEEDDLSSVASSFFFVPTSSPPRTRTKSASATAAMKAGDSSPSDPRIISPIPRGASCPSFTALSPSPPTPSAPIRILHPPPPRSHPLPPMAAASSPLPTTMDSPFSENKHPVTISATSATSTNTQSDSPELQQEVVRLRNIVEALTAENANLNKRLDQEGMTILKKENEMLKQSILRFRTEFSRQAQHLRRRGPVPRHPDGQIHHSLRLSRKPTDSSSEISPLSFSSVTTPSPVASTSSPKRPTANELRPASKEGGNLKPPHHSHQQPLLPNPELSPKNLELAFRNLAARYEGQLRELSEECNRYKASLRSCEVKVKHLAEENVKQLKVIREYDAKWKKLEQSARQKLQQRQGGKSLSTSSSMDSPSEVDLPTPPTPSHHH